MLVTLSVVALVSLAALVVALRAVSESREKARSVVAEVSALSAKVQAMDERVVQAYGLAHSASIDAKKARTSKK